MSSIAAARSYPTSTFSSMVRVLTTSARRRSGCRCFQSERREPAKGQLMDENLDPTARPGEMAYAPMVKLVEMAFVIAELVERINLLEARIAELEGGPRARH